jgi:hypothetical protein
MRAAGFPSPTVVGGRYRFSRLNEPSSSRAAEVVGSPAVRLYALVSEESGAVIDWYPSREEAYIALRECLADEVEWRDVLFVWPVEFEVSPN